MFLTDNNSILTSIGLLTFVLRLETTFAVDEDEICPTWYVFNRTSKKCFCHSLNEWVICNQFNQNVHLARGLCMTFDNSTGKIDVGKCPYTILDKQHEAIVNGYVELPNNSLDLNEFMCGSWNREGYLCSKCKEGYGLTVANIFQKCVKCQFSKGVGWFFYFMLQLIPLTVLFFVVSVFHVSLARPPLNAYVVFCQISTAILFTQTDRFYPPYVVDSLTLRTVFYCIFLALGIWNMTLTRYMDYGITNFCVDPNINIQQAFTLTQIQSLFPLVLVSVMYTCIKLHARNCRLIVWLWRPFHRCYVSSTRAWNSELSLVDVFSTFLLLSYSRFIFQLYYIVSFQYTYRATSMWNQTASLLYNPAVPYFHATYHLPYILILLLIFMSVAVPPIALLALYQIRAFQKVLAWIHLHNVPSIHIFVDLFHGCFKNGTGGTYDLRFAASLYVILRIVIIIGVIGCNYTLFANCTLAVILTLASLLLLFFALVRPYKDQCMNVLDSLLLFGLVIVTLLLIITTHNVVYKTFNLLVLIIVLVIIAIPQAILYGFLLYKLCCRLCKLHCCQRFIEQLQKVFECPTNYESAELELMESIPDRTDNLDCDYSLNV